MSFKIMCKDCDADQVAEQVDKRGRPVPEVLQELRAKGLMDDHKKRFTSHRAEVEYEKA